MPPSIPLTRRPLARVLLLARSKSIAFLSGREQRAPRRVRQQGAIASTGVAPFWLCIVCVPRCLYMFLDEDTRLGHAADA